MTGMTQSPAALPNSLADLSPETLGGWRLLADTASLSILQAGWPALEVLSETSESPGAAGMIVASFLDGAGLAARLQARRPGMPNLDLFADFLPARLAGLQPAQALAAPRGAKGVLLLGDAAIEQYLALPRITAKARPLQITEADLLRPCLLGLITAEALLGRSMDMACARDGLGCIALSSGMLEHLGTLGAPMLQLDLLQWVEQRVTLLVGDWSATERPPSTTIVSANPQDMIDALGPLFNSAPPPVPASAPAPAQAPAPAPPVLSETSVPPPSAGGRRFAGVELLELSELRWTATPLGESELLLAPQGGSIAVRSVRNVMDGGWLRLNLRASFIPVTLHLSAGEGEEQEFTLNSPWLVLAIPLPSRRAAPLRIYMRTDQRTASFVANSFDWQQQEPPPPDGAPVLRLGEGVMAWAAQ